MKLTNRYDNSNEIVNLAVDKICALFPDTAQSVFSFRANNRAKGKQTDEVWYTNSCRVKRKDFHRARKRYNRIKSKVSKVNRDIMKKAAKKYKNEMSICYGQFPA